MALPLQEDHPGIQTKVSLTFLSVSIFTMMNFIFFLTAVGSKDTDLSEVRKLDDDSFGFGSLDGTLTSKIFYY